MNITTNTYALLIQGPIMSIGQGSYKYKSYLDKNVNIIHHDSETTIKKVIKKYGSLFKEIILSTWDNEILSDNFSKFCNLNNVKVYKFKKNKNLFIGSKQINSYTRYNNNRVQYTGCFKGIKKIYKSSHVIRIRTDQFINLKNILDQIDSNKIYVPALYYKDNYFQIEDFYFARTKKKLEEFFKISSKLILHRSAQINPLLALISIKYKKFKIEELQTNSSIVQLISYIYLKENFFPLSKKIFNNIEWRGEKSSDYWKKYHSHKIFTENLHELNIDKHLSKFINYYKFFFNKNSSISKKIFKKFLRTIYNLPL